MVGGFAVLAQTVLLKSFVRVESAEMSKNVERAVDAIDYNLGQVSAKGTDWSGWSETYKFVKDHNQDYIDENLATSTVTDQNLNFLAFYDSRGKLVYAASGSIETGEDIPYSAALQKLLVPGSPLLAVGATEQVHQGIVLLPEGPLMLVTRSVTDQNDTPQILKPDGTVVFGTYLNDARTAELSKLSQLPLKFYPYNDSKLPSDVQAYNATALGQAQKSEVKPLDGNTVAGYGIVKDIFGKPGLIVRVEQPRSSYGQGRHTIAYFLVLMLGAGALLALVLGLILNRFVVGPVRRLAKDVAGIEGHNKGSYRVHVPKQHDEVGRLAGGINTMLGSLEDARTELEQQKGAVEQQVVERTRELAAAQAELEASVRSLPFGFAVIDQNDSVVFFNSLLSRLMGHTISTDAAESKAALQAFSKDYADILDVLGCIHDAQVKRQPIEKHVSKGSQFFRFFFMPVLSGPDAKQVLGTVLIMEDETEEKAAQRSRDEFFSIASHELRTPLTAIRGNSGMLIDYYGKDLKDPDMKTMLTDIHSSSLRLIDIVNDFLDMSRLEMGKIEFKTEPVDTAELVKQILREYDVTSSHQKLRLTLGPVAKGVPMAQADKERLRQILINLVGNGLKFTEEGGVTIHVAEGKAGRVKISVTDTGKGIAESMQHLLFRKLQQASESILTRDDTQSAGLGLYISRLLAEGMGGTLVLESSELGKGSTFTLELPAAKAQQKKL